MRAAWNMPRNLALIALAGLTSAGPLSAAAGGGTQATARPGDARGTEKKAEAPRRITLDFVEAEIADIAKALSVQSGVNIAVSANAKGKLTLRLKGTTLEDALKFASQLAGLDFRRVGETYVIGTPDELRSFVARSGVSDLWVPQHLNPGEAKNLLQAAAPFVTVQVQEKSRQVVLLGMAEDVAAARKFLTAADVPGAEPAPVQAGAGTVTRIYQLKYLHPVSAMQSLSGSQKDQNGKLYPTLDVRVGPEPFAPNPANFMPLSVDSTKAIAGQKVSSNEGSNGMGSNGQTKSRSLILMGAPAEVNAAIELLRSIDVAPPQVLIEARLVEMSPEKFKELGLLFDFNRTSFQEENEGRDALRLGRFLRTPLDIDVQINALTENRDARLLANPRISVIDGEDASIFIGDLLRFRVLQSVTAVGEQFTVQEVPVGIALLVRPRVHDDANITLKVHPVVSTVTSFVGPERIPQTATREADSTIRMRDGETVVIGGLIREEDISIMSKVPGLGDLPLIGKLFQNKTTTKRRSEVTVFLTARLVR